MNNPEPLLVIKSTSEISLKKALSKLKIFLESTSSNNSSLGNQIRIGKLSDELVEKLQTLSSSIQSHLQQSESSPKSTKEEKKSKKRNLDVSEEEAKPKKKKSRKSETSKQ